MDERGMPSLDDLLKRVVAVGELTSDGKLVSRQGKDGHVVRVGGHARSILRYSDHAVSL
jgi:roadblock/LC7 domain-containing protein